MNNFMTLYNHIIAIIFIYIIYIDPLIAKEAQFYDLSAKSIDGQLIYMNKYEGKKILIVNVASKCGYTYRYEGLQKLHNQYGNQLVILGFPSNDFFWQEPGTNNEIKTFCKINYGVTFQLFEKIHVKGKNQHPIYNWLSDIKLNGWNDNYPKWNFHKYLIDEKGALIDYFDMSINPTDTSIIKYLIKPIQN